jgi:cytochrome c-type biogenesis protein CcmH
MIAFCLAAALLSALAGALVLQRAARLAARPATDPTLDVYRRQLGEIDDLAERGLLAEPERRMARAEAARRLLTAAGEAGKAVISPTSKAGRMAVLAAAVIAPLLAAGLYLALGSPGTPDQPFATRLAAWRAGDPRELTPPQMAAVLQDVVKARPTDPRARLFLARAQAASGDLPSAVETLRTAVRVSPPDADLYAALGEALVEQAQGAETPEAVAAFKKTAALDPNAFSARYHLARARIMSGDVAGGLADWRAMAAQLPPGDAATVALEQRIAATEKAGRLVETPIAEAQAQSPQAAQVASAPPAQQRAMIQSMVDGLAARLKASPDDPEGWARLIRAYGVLGETDRLAAAKADAEAAFKGKPDRQKALAAALAGAPQP